VFEVSVSDDVLSAQRNGVREFPWLFNGWRGPVLFLVSPHPFSETDNVRQRAEAAQAATQRFWNVDLMGVELPGKWAGESVTDSVVEPQLLDDGIVVGAFCGDLIGPNQAETLLRILIGELYGRQVSAHVSCPPADVDHRNLRAWPTGSEQPEVRRFPRDSPDHSWYVYRTVHCVTTTGVRYLEWEWLQPDGTWSRDRTGALTFASTRDAMREVGDFVTRVREETGADEDPRVNNVNGLLLHPEQDHGWPMPPDDIRDHGHVWNLPASAED
jgi:hypothetical protein